MKRSHEPLVVAAMPGIGDSPRTRAEEVMGPVATIEVT